jgi:acetyl esterase/lipase
MHRPPAIVVSVLLASALLAEASAGLAAAEIRVEEGPVYARRGDVELALDIALPEGDGNARPLILCIHGGGWRGGNRGAYRDLIRGLAARGYVAATASYRLTDVAAWPAQIDDVRDALRWLRKNAARYGIDPERVGAMGHSAGGHLSLMLGLMPDGESLADVRVQAVVNYFGPTALEIAEFTPDVDRLIEWLAGGPRAEKLDALRDASPLSYVGRGDAPVLTFHGTADAIVPVHQAKVLQEALEKANVPARARILEGLNHSWGGADAEKSLKETAAFFDTYLRGGELPLVAREDFDDGADRWKPMDPAAWEVRNAGGRTLYSLKTKATRYSPPVRSPVNIALLEGPKVADFVFDVDLRSTQEPYGHQDLCLIFGWVDPSHYYYVHFGRQADAHANSIFLVDGAPRVSIATERTQGTDWSRGWHRARVKRDAAGGRIEVYFDDLEKPVMVAVDAKFPAGRLGLGSFDDTGDFDAVRVYGKTVE